jgi:hypothetical protein
MCRIANVEGVLIELARESRMYWITCVYVRVRVLGGGAANVEDLGIELTCQHVCMCSIANVEDLGIALARQSRVYHVTSQHACTACTACVAYSC